MSDRRVGILALPTHVEPDVASPLSFTLEHRRGLALGIQSVGLSVAGGLLGGVAIGILGGQLDHMTSVFDPRPVRPFNPECGLAGAVSTGLLCALVPTLVHRRKEPGDALSRVTKTCTQLAVINTPLTLLLLIFGAAIAQHGFDRDGFASTVSEVVTMLALIAVAGAVGSVIAAPLGLAFGFLFTPVLEPLSSMTAGRDARVAEITARRSAVLSLLTALAVHLGADGAFVWHGTWVALGCSVGLGLSWLFLTVARRRARARLLETCAVIEASEATVPLGVLRLDEGPCKRAVVAGSAGPYRDERVAIALVS